MIPQTLINKYKIENQRLAAYVEYLNILGVVGFEKQHDLNMVSLWLDKNKIPHEKNDRYFIWIDTLGENLKKWFKKPLK